MNKNFYLINILLFLFRLMNFDFIAFKYITDTNIFIIIINSDSNTANLIDTMSIIIKYQKKFHI